MARLEMQIETEHPILFLADSGPDVTIPDVTDTFASASRDCVAFNVLSYVDGATAIIVCDEACSNNNAIHMIQATICAASAVVTVSDSGAFSYLNVPVEPGNVLVDIWADDVVNPTWVWIRLDAIKTF